MAPYFYLFYFWIILQSKQGKNNISATWQNTKVKYSFLVKLRSFTNIDVLKWSRHFINYICSFFEASCKNVLPFSIKFLWFRILNKILVWFYVIYLFDLFFVINYLSCTLYTSLVIVNMLSKIIIEQLCQKISKFVIRIYYNYIPIYFSFVRWYINITFKQIHISY